MLTIDAWYKTKLNILTQKGEERDIFKRAPLDTFVMLVKSELSGTLLDAGEWNKLFDKYKKTGRIK